MKLILSYFLLVIGSIVLFGMSFLSAYLGVYESAFKYAFLGVLLVIFSSFYIVYIKPRTQGTGKDELLEWLVENEEMVSNYGSRFKDEEITNETVMVRFSIIYSAFFLTRKIYTDFYVLGSNAAFNMKLFSIVFNLGVGWWTVPNGLIETPKSIYENLLVKHTVTVGEFLKNKHLYIKPLA